MKINRLVLGPLGTNCYIFCDEKTGDAAVVDPAYDASTILKSVKLNNCTLRKIILTHGHYDHIGGLSDILDMCKEVKLYTHIFGKEVLGDVNKNCSMDIGGVSVTFTPDVTVEDGDFIKFGDSGFEILYTPGHTIDSMCLKMGDIVFCGDTVFRFSVGRCDLPTGDFKSIIKSIKTKLMTLPDDTVLYPGHGESTTVGEERRLNPYLNRF